MSIWINFVESIKNIAYGSANFVFKINNILVNVTKFGRIDIFYFSNVCFHRGAFWFATMHRQLVVKFNKKSGSSVSRYTFADGCAQIGGDVHMSDETSGTIS